MKQKFTANSAVFTINSAIGDISLIPKNRTWKISFRGFAKNMQIKVLVDNLEVPYEVIVDTKKIKEQESLLGEKDAEIDAAYNALQEKINNLDYYEVCKRKRNSGDVCDEDKAAISRSIKLE